MHHQRARHEVAQAAILGVQQHGDNAHAIKKREEIHHSQNIAGNGLKGVDRPSGLFNDPDSSPALAGSLSFPEGFKSGVISPNQAEIHNSQNCPYPHPVLPYGEHGAAHHGLVNNQQHHGGDELD